MPAHSPDLTPLSALQTPPYLQAPTAWARLSSLLGGEGFFSQFLPVDLPLIFCSFLSYYLNSAIVDVNARLQFLFLCRQPFDLSAKRICLSLQHLLTHLQQTQIILHQSSSWAVRAVPASCCNLSNFHTSRLCLNTAILLHKTVTVCADCKQPHLGFPPCCILSLVMTNLLLLYPKPTRILLESSSLLINSLCPSDPCTASLSPARTEAAHLHFQHSW